MVKTKAVNEAALSEAEGRSLVIGRHRHFALLRDCRDCLQNFLNPSLSVDMACEELRLALKQLESILGHIDNERVLDVLFSEFCIGK
mmetsp:Transcript_10855/g.18171  ORF Transcript_10855/g.18171 Transcript_10855/m.18171 type:complete len:87 (+) Transcript_10855:2-262(+)